MLGMRANLLGEFARIVDSILIAKEIQKGLLFFKPSTTWRTSLKHHLPFGFFFSH